MIPTALKFAWFIATPGLEEKRASTVVGKGSSLCTHYNLLPADVFDTFSYETKSLYEVTARFGLHVSRPAQAPHGHNRVIPRSNVEVAWAAFTTGRWKAFVVLTRTLPTTMLACTCTITNCNKEQTLYLQLDGETVKLICQQTQATQPLGQGMPCFFLLKLTTRVATT